MVDFVNESFLNSLIQYKVAQNRCYGINPVEDIIPIVEDLQARKAARVKYDFLLAGGKTVNKIIREIQQKLIELDIEFHKVEDYKRKQEIVAEALKIREQMKDLLGV